MRNIYFLDTENINTGNPGNYNFTEYISFPILA